MRGCRPTHEAGKDGNRPGRHAVAGPPVLPAGGEADPSLTELFSAILGARARGMERQGT